MQYQGQLSAFVRSNSFKLPKRMHSTRLQQHVRWNQAANSCTVFGFFKPSWHLHHNYHALRNIGQKLVNALPKSAENQYTGHKRIFGCQRRTESGKAVSAATHFPVLFQRLATSEFNWPSLKSMYPSPPEITSMFVCVLSLLLSLFSLLDVTPLTPLLGVPGGKTQFVMNPTWTRREEHEEQTSTHSFEHRRLANSADHHSVSVVVD